MGSIFIWPKNDVYAAECEGTVSLGVRQNNTWSTEQPPYTSNTVPQQIRIRTTNSNIKNNQLTFKGGFFYRVNGVTKDTVNPTVRIQYGSANSIEDITNNCTVTIQKYYTDGEYPTNYTEVTVVYTCNYKGTNQNANIIQTNITNMALTTNNAFVLNYTTQCTMVLPSEIEELINSNEQNTGQIINSITSAADEITSSIQNQINAMINGGLAPAGSTTGVDSTQYNNTHGKEMGLLNGNQFNPQTIQITKDDYTINWILNYIYTLYHTNFMVGGLMITLLSIGLIKLALNR